MSKNKNIFIISDVWFNRPIGEFSSMTNEEYNNLVNDVEMLKRIILNKKSTS